MVPIPDRFRDQRARRSRDDGDVLDQIRKLPELHAQGVLTGSEFPQKKAELLQVRVPARPGRAPLAGERHLSSD